MRLILFCCSNLEKCGKFWKNSRFSGRIWPDWGNNAWADMAGLGSKGLKYKKCDRNKGRLAKEVEIRLMLVSLV